MLLAAGREPGGSDGKAPGKRMGACVADAPANADADQKGAVPSLLCSPVNVFCCAEPLDKLAVVASSCTLDGE